MGNRNVVNLMNNVPQLRIIWSNKQANNFVRNAISPEQKSRVYKWLIPQEYSTNKLMEDLTADTSHKSSSIEEPSLIKNCVNPDVMMRLMSMYTQKKPASHLPKIVAPSSPSTSSYSLQFSEFLSETRPFSRQGHENRKKILNSLLSETEIEPIRNYKKSSHKKH